MVATPLNNIMAIFHVVQNRPFHIQQKPYMKPPSPNFRTDSTTSFKFQPWGWDETSSEALLSRWFSKLLFWWDMCPLPGGYVCFTAFLGVSRSASSDSEASSRFEVSPRWLGRLQRWLKHRKFKVPPYTKLAKGWAFVDEPAVVALGWFVDFLLCFGWTF